MALLLIHFEELVKTTYSRIFFSIQDSATETTKAIKWMKNTEKSLYFDFQ